MDKQQGPAGQHRELCPMSYGSLDGRGVWGRMDMYICMAESVPLLFNSNYHNIVDRLYSYTKRQVFFLFFNYSLAKDGLRCVKQLLTPHRN